jgi:aryl-alcohol dehydrogenase-like predicted oxidoreductase
MRYIDIPGTDLSVSAICLGTVDFGTRLVGDDADRLVTAFLDAGGNFFDTAHCYAFWMEDGLGASERGLGACLTRLGVWDRVVVGTKGGHPEVAPDYPRPDSFLAPDVLEADITESLDRLGVGYVPLYYLHRDDGRVPVSEIIDALNVGVADGRIGYLGASNWSVARIAEANEYAAAKGLRGFAVSQPQWSLAVPDYPMGDDPCMRYVIDEDAAEYARLGVPVVAYTSTASGYFAREADAGGSFGGDANRARHERVRELAAKLGCSPTQVALAWLMHQAPITIPILGTTKVDHLRDALGAVDVTLTAEQVRWLRQG